MKSAVVLGLVVLLGGCGPKPADTAPTMTGSPQASAASTSGGGGSDSVAPIGPNVGAMTPVAGGENLGGGTGGGLGQRAKDMARNAAAQSSQPTAGGDDSGQ